MACKEGKTNINGRDYYVIQMSPDKSVKLQLKLVKIFSGSFATLAAAMGAGRERQAMSLGASISALFKTSSEEEIFETIKQVVETAKVDGQRIQFDVSFAGEYIPDIYKVFFWVLKVNFADFFEESGILDAIKSQVTAALATLEESKQLKKRPQT